MKRFLMAMIAVTLATIAVGCKSHQMHRNCSSCGGGGGYSDEALAPAPDWDIAPSAEPASTFGTN